MSALPFRVGIVIQIESAKAVLRRLSGLARREQMHPARPRFVGTLILLSVLTCAGVRAMTVVPLSIDDLAISSVASVIGSVRDISGVRARDGSIYTLIGIEIQDVLSGTLPATVITLKEDGGAVGDEVEVVSGAPTFEIGERVLLFLTTRKDGSLRTNHLQMGKFRIELGDDGLPQARQELAPATVVVLPPGVMPPGATVRLSDVVTAITRNAAGNGAAVRTMLAEPPEAADATLLHTFSEAFTLAPTPGRFFEADEGMPLSFLIDQRGDSILGLTVSRQAVDNAFAAWTNVQSAALTLQDGGLTADTSEPCPDAHPYRIRFDDPDGEIPDPVGCHGILAIGGFRFTTAEAKTFGGTTFDRSRCATLTLADGWTGCTVWMPCNVAEIATHEIGHAIGLAHSSDREPEPNFDLRDATMYFIAHFDGRCASVRSDDIAGVSFIYPTAMPPTITTQDPLPTATATLFYSQTLHATGGSGPYTWDIESTNIAGMSLSPDGVLSGAPTSTATSTTYFRIKATDGNGDSHIKLLTITLNPGPPSATPTLTLPPTLTATATTSPTVTMSPTTSPTLAPTFTTVPTETDTPRPTLSPTALASSTPTGAPTPSCIGDCDGSGEVTVDEIVRLANIALGSAAIATCPAGDRDGDGSISVDEIVAAVNAALSGCR